jgi:sulfur-carrier protein
MRGACAGGGWRRVNDEEEGAAVRVKVYATLRDLLGTRAIDLDITQATTIRQLLDDLVAVYPALADKLRDSQGNLTGQVHIMLNGRPIEFLDGLATQVVPTDTLSLFPPVGGG